MRKNNDKNDPLITIGITSYNARQTIDAAIQSALNQEWAHTEIILVDDGSNDGSWDYLQKQYGDQIRLFQNTVNGGVAVSRNKIIKEATGAFIAFFDDDDVSAPDRLSKQYQRLIDHKHDLTFCHTARQQIYPDGNKRLEPTIDNHSGLAVAQRVLFGKPLKNNDIGSLATCSQMARTSTYRTLNGFDEFFRRVEDTDMTIRGALKGAHFIGVSQPLVTQTMTASSEKTIDEEQKFVTALIEKHKIFLQEQDQFIHVKAWTDLKFQFYRGRKKGFVVGLGLLLLKHPIRTLQRLFWAMPNIGFNITYKKFQDK